MYWQQYQGVSHIKILVSFIIGILSLLALLLRGLVHSKPLFDTRLLQYPEFVVAILISFLGGGLFVFILSMLGKMLGGILQMPLKDVYHFLNFLAILLLVAITINFILLAKNVSAYWLMIIGLIAIAFSANTLLQLNTEFSFDNIIFPSVIGIAGSGTLVLAVIVIAVKSVPPKQIGKVANFRSVAFALGIAITAVDLGRMLDFQRVRNFNSMIRYSDSGDPLFQERLNTLQSFYQANGYDATQAYDAAVQGAAGTIKLQAFFKGMSQVYWSVKWFCIDLAIIVLILWLIRNHRIILDFLTFKNKRNEAEQAATNKN
jgi:hypothetical protein